jgi:hypothetical protein
LFARKQYRPKRTLDDIGVWATPICTSPTLLSQEGLPGPEPWNAVACHAITVSGFTMTRAGCHYTRDSHIQSQRSAFTSRHRRGRVRSNTCNWCRSVSTSSCRTARERAQLRRVSRSARKREMMVREPCAVVACNINAVNRNRLFSRRPVLAPVTG